MKHFLAFLSHLLPIRMLLSTLLLITLFFTSALPAMAARITPNEGTVQLDEITQASKDTAATPSALINPLDQSAEGGINEVQGNADRDKMLHSEDTELPVVSQIKKALKK